jgi:hypothetical protein
MDFAHETKKKTRVIVEQKGEPIRTVVHGYPYSSVWDLIHQCDSIRPLLRKIDYP